MAGYSPNLLCNMQQPSSANRMLGHISHLFPLFAIPVPPPCFCTYAGGGRCPSPANTRSTPTIPEKYPGSMHSLISNPITAPACHPFFRLALVSAPLGLRLSKFLRHVDNHLLRCCVGNGFQHASSHDDVRASSDRMRAKSLNDVGVKVE